MKNVAHCFCCGRTWNCGDFIPPMCDACSTDGHDGRGLFGCQRCFEKDEASQWVREANEFIAAWRVLTAPTMAPIPTMRELLAITVDQ